MALPDLEALEQELKEYSHGDTAITILKSALKGLDLPTRQNLIDAHFVCDPIAHDAAVARMGKPVQKFHVLQGDVIRTESAFMAGRRQNNFPSFIITTSTCDLVVGRAASHGAPAIVSLLFVEPRRLSSYPTHEKYANELTNLLSFRTKKYFYLPALADDPEDVLFNIVHLGAIAQLENVHLPAVERRASLTVLGWRAMGGLVRSLQIREAEEEAELRIAMARSPYTGRQTA